MFYMHMNAMVAMSGMIAVLMLTRKWADNKRILMIIFSLCFLLLFSKKLVVFYAAFTIINYFGLRVSVPDDDLAESHLYFRHCRQYRRRLSRGSLFRDGHFQQSLVRCHHLSRSHL